MKPKLATSAVINTGRSRISEPSRTARLERMPFLAQLVDVGDQDDAVQHRHAKEGNEADRGGLRRRPRSPIPP
jgi:hypothetical protein